MNAKAFGSMINHFRVMEGDMSLRRIEVLLYVYRKGEAPLRQISKELDITPSNTTKIAQSWSALDQNKRPGPKYVTVEADPMNLSTKIVKMTPKGRRMVETILSFDDGRR